MMGSYAQNINDKTLTKTGYFQYEKRTISIKCYRQYTRDINTYHKNYRTKINQVYIRSSNDAAFIIWSWTNMYNSERFE